MRSFFDEAPAPGAQLPSRDRIGSVRHPGPVRAALVALVVAVSTAIPAPSQASADVITFEGGGWGHGIGMPQWGALGQAEEGFSWSEIIEYWYTGVGIRNVANIDNVPNPIRVGINYVLVGSERQHRPFLWLDFQPQGGPVSICLPGEAEGGCSLTAVPGETWRLRWREQAQVCSLMRNGDPVHDSPSCDVRLYWADQPNTRVRFPGGDVDRTFARGSVAFVGPVVRNGQRGFHLNIVVDLDEYVYGIAEVSPSWHMEALKAQAVAARTYAAWKASNGLRSDCSCHVVWDTWDQAYRGWHHLTEGNATHGARWRQASDATAGRVVVYPAGSKKLAQTYYSSSTGGATENVWEVWNSSAADFPYLATRPDPWSVKFVDVGWGIRWTRSLAAGSIAATLREREPAGSPFKALSELVSIAIVGRNASGSPSRIEITGLVGGQPVTKTYVSRSPQAGQGTITQLVVWFGLASHYISSINGSPGAASGSGGGDSGSVPACAGIEYTPSNPTHVLYPGSFPIDDKGRVVVDLRKENSGRIVFWDGVYTGSTRINGTHYGDIICGGENEPGHFDWIHGRGGDDVIYGRAGDNVLMGGAGDDTIYGGTGNDTIRGGRGNDTLHGGSGNNVMRGGAGDDIMYGGPGDDIMRGGPGNDTMYGVAGTNTMYGGRGHDVMHAGSGDGNRLFGGPGDDTLNAGTGNDNILRGHAGNDTLIGGPGHGTIMYGNRGDDTIVGGSGDFHRMFGGPGNNTITVGSGRDHFVGSGPGNDTIIRP
jgi:SpoIID/LytB domain protein